MFRRIPIAGFVSLIAIATTASAQQATLSRSQVQSTELERPAELQVQAPADSTILKARSTEALLRQRPVQKRMTIQSVRAQPIVQLKQGTADMRPVLQNPASPINVAQRLRTAPQLATVQADTFEVAEIPEGIVVRQFLAYQLQPGACTDPGKRRTVESKGVECFTRKTDSQRKAGFSDSADQARYVADPAARSRAIAARKSRILCGESSQRMLNPAYEIYWRHFSALPILICHRRISSRLTRIPIASA